MTDNNIIFQRLNEIRELRNEELFEQRDNSVFYTDVMALEKGNTGNQIYRIMEEYSIGENHSSIRELFYIYTNKPELVAIIDSEKYEGIHQPDGKEAVTDEQKAEWELLVKDIEEGIAKSEENIKNQAIKIGISEKEIEGLSELDIQKRIIEKIDEKNEQNNDEQNNEKEKDEKVPFSLSEESAKKHGIIGVNTISLEQQVGIHGETLKKELGLDGKEQYADVSEIEIIPSYKVRNLGEKVPDTPFIAVARHSDGSVEAFPESVCSIYKGANNQTVEFDDQNVVNKLPDTIIQFNGKNTSLAISQLSDRVDASIAYNTRDNNKRIALNLKDKYEGIGRIDYKAREAINQHEGTEHNRDIIKEKSEHDKVGCDKTEIEDANGNPNDGHIHFNPESQEQQNAIDSIVKQSAVGQDSRISREEAERLFVEKIEETKGQLTPEEVAERVIDDMNEHIRSH